MSESRVNMFEESKQRLLKTGKAVIAHLGKMMLLLSYCIFSLVRCGGKL